MVHIALAIILFIIVNWFGKHSSYKGYMQISIFAKRDEAPAFNFVYKAFAPVVFITIVSALFYIFWLDFLIKEIYFVVIYYFLFRIFFNIITERALLINWFTQIAYIIVAIPSSYYVYSNFIVYKDFFFPTPEELGSVIWLGIIAYLYGTLNNIEFSNIKTINRKTKYIEKKYKKYKSNYGDIIGKYVHNNAQEALVYAILIFESFNRPKIFRIIESVLFTIGKAKTLGIMQITTDKYIDDKKSVELGTQKIVKDTKNLLDNEEYTNYQTRRAAIKSYNSDSDYINEVNLLYNQIYNDFYSNSSKRE